MKLIVNCMECSDQIELGSFDAEVIHDWLINAPWLLTNVICDPCLKDKFDIDVAEIDELLASGALDD